MCVFFQFCVYKITDFEIQALVENLGEIDEANEDTEESPLLSHIDRKNIGTKKLRKLEEKEQRRLQGRIDIDRSVISTDNPVEKK